MKVLGIIPARYASTRFPGKPLAIIHGKTMIQRVYEQVKKSSAVSEAVVATDDHRIEEQVLSFGGKVVMTSDTHRTGTDRCLEAAKKIMQQSGIDYDVTINIQGDEPFIDPSQIDKVASCFLKPEVQIATLVKKLFMQDELFNPNIIKVVVDKNNRALYFSRSPIPYLRGKEPSEWLNNHNYYKHIGIYAYRSEVHVRIALLAPSPLEIAESLEQLRWLQNGYSIHVEYTEHESISVDTPEDLSKLINNY